MNGFSFGKKSIQLNDDTIGFLNDPNFDVKNVALDDLIKKYPKATEGSITFAKSVRDGNVSLKEGQTYLQAYQKQLNQTGFNLKNIGSSIKNLGGKFIAGTINAIGGMVIGAAASLVVEGISQLFKEFSGKAEEEAKQKISELGETARSEFKSIQDEMNSTASKVNEVKDRYAELAQGVGNLGKATQNQGSLSNDDYEEFLNISNDLADLFPTLTNGYTDNGDAILDLNGDVQIITSSLNGLVEAQKAVAAQDMAKQICKICKKDYE